MTRRMFRYLALGLLTTNLATFSEGYASSSGDPAIIGIQTPAQEFSGWVKHYAFDLALEGTNCIKIDDMTKIIEALYGADLVALSSVEPVAHMIATKIPDGNKGLFELYLGLELAKIPLAKVKEIYRDLTAERLANIRTVDIYNIIKLPTSEERVRRLEELPAEIAKMKRRYR